MTVTAIIAAGGKGARLGANVAKQFVKIGGRSILQRAVDVFDRSDRIDDIIVAAPHDGVSEASRSVHADRKRLTAVAGGERRQDSVANAFDAVCSTTDIVVVHDAARPFVSGRLISVTIEAAAESGAAVAALMAKETVKQASVSSAGRVVGATLDRESIYLAQTPQAFRRRVLEDAVALGRAGRQATDEAELAEAAGHRVRLVEGEPTNIKVTTQEDLAYARFLIEGGSRSVPCRVGLGYDLHRLVEGRRLMLGGVAIPHTSGLAGHSDADALFHAVTDALLGAVGAGDIGRHFPDTDHRWKNQPSGVFLRQAGLMVREAGFEVENVDAVIIAEQPKLAPYTDQMRHQLAAVLDVSPAIVSIKGKTNEGVDATGEGRAIAVHAVVLVRGA